jgi:hypothetical protein
VTGFNAPASTKILYESRAFFSNFQTPKRVRVFTNITEEARLVNHSFDLVIH